MGLAPQSMYLFFALKLKLIYFSFIFNLVNICSFKANSAVRLGEPKVWFCELDGKYNQTVGHTKQYVKVVLEGRQFS